MQATIVGLCPCRPSSKSMCHVRGGLARRRTDPRKRQDQTTPVLPMRQCASCSRIFKQKRACKTLETQVAALLCPSACCHDQPDPRRALAPVGAEVRSTSRPLYVPLGSFWSVPLQCWQVGTIPISIMTDDDNTSELKGQQPQSKTQIQVWS